MHLLTSLFPAYLLATVRSNKKTSKLNILYLITFFQKKKNIMGSEITLAELVL